MSQPLAAHRSKGRSKVMISTSLRNLTEDSESDASDDRRLRPENRVGLRQDPLGAPRGIDEEDLLLRTNFGSNGIGGGVLSERESDSAPDIAPKIRLRLAGDIGADKIGRAGGVSVEPLACSDWKSCIMVFCKDIGDIAIESELLLGLPPDLFQYSLKIDLGFIPLCSM